MLDYVIWGGAALVALVVFDRLLLWAESRGWIYYRKNKPRGGGAVYHFLEMSSVFSPGIKEVIEVKVSQEQNQDESGDPLGRSRTQTGSADKRDLLEP